MREMTKLFKALANERRLNILKLLILEHELSVSDISESINLSFKSTSKHLIILERSGFVKYRNASLHTLYSINNKDNKTQKELIKVIK